MLFRANSVLLAVVASIWDYRDSVTGLDFDTNGVACASAQHRRSGTSQDEAVNADKTEAATDWGGRFE
jgi:hypothetical protein